MSDVLRNVGELASPYYLLELWVRKWEIDLDPETYATLKRKTQRLVRGAAAFDLRGERPDDAWRALRREVIGIEDVAVGAGTLDGAALDVLLAATGDQRAPDGRRA